MLLVTLHTLWIFIQPALAQQNMRKIVFISQRDVGGYPTIYVMNEDGTNQQPLIATQPDSWATKPVWSSNGEFVLFSVYHQDMRNTEILVVMPDKSIVHRYSLHEIIDPITLSLSPDDKRIAFSTYQPSGRSQVYTVNLDGSELRPLTTEESFSMMDYVDEFSPTWSADSTKVAFIGRILTSNGNDENFALYVVEVGKPKSLVRWIADISYAPIAWSPNGEQIVFVSSHNELCLLKVQLLTTTCVPRAEFLSEFTWSPNGMKFAFSAYDEGTEGKRSIHIWVSNLSLDLQQVTRDNTVWSRSPSWSPNENGIVYVQEGADGQFIYRIALNGQNKVLLTTNDKDDYPAWQRS